MKKLLVILTAMLVFATGCEAQNAKDTGKSTPKSSARVTFIELGSVNCIPCVKMQPVMKSIEEKYGEQVNVVFHDVWTDKGKPFARKFGIKLIPTQVFLDENGKEFHRHEGFYPEAEIEKILSSKGLKQIKK